MTKNNVVFITSLLLYQSSVLLCFFHSVAIGLLGFAVASVTYIVWLVIGKIEPYKNSIYNHMPNWLVYRRSFRIKFAVSALIIFFVMLQLDFGFVAMKKSWAGDVSFSWVAGSAAIGIIIYLLKDFVANKRTPADKKTFGGDAN
jgi:hypothetical protein